MLYNQTFNLDQVSFAAEGIKDAQQTVYLQELLCYFLSNFTDLFNCCTISNLWFLTF